MRLSLVTPPAAEPVDLAEAKAHLRVDGNDEDTLIDGLVTAAREQSEAFTKRAFIEQQWDLQLDEFPDAIEVPMPPLIEVVSVTYVDSSGDTQTLPASDYQVVTGSGPYTQPAWIVAAHGKSWPSTRRQPDAVTVRFKAGYGAEKNDVPASIRQAIQLYVGDLYEHREGTVVGTIVASLPRASQALLMPAKVVRL